MSVITRAAPRPLARRCPARSHVEIWARRSAAGSLGGAGAPGHLVESEVRRALQFVHPADQAHFVERQNLLREVLATYLGVDPASVPLERATTGKPCLGGAAAGFLSFNAAASGDLMVIAVSTGGEVGVDVERLAPAADPAELAGELGEAENAYIDGRASGAGRWAAFLRCWTAREAAVKANGRGLRIALPSFEVDPRTGEVHSDRCAVELPPLVTWFTPVRGWIAALATWQPAPQLVLID